LARVLGQRGVYGCTLPLKNPMVAMQGLLLWEEGRSKYARAGSHFPGTLLLEKKMGKEKMTDEKSNVRHLADSEKGREKLLLELPRINAKLLG